ncbi:hypothetical protein A4A49_10277 [Nicotiana attenuata]|uniref:Chromo domain-containing protein n=1 Tax=Nicotiana attenuata TaxID=49451 RepID=A0A1J6J616_NICAT|nr:hypothetical protein A4A49_10277 [Nicotiana attenuata]
MIGNFAQAHKGDTGGIACIGRTHLESKSKVGDSKAYFGTMQMEHGGIKKSWADIVEEDGKLQIDATLSDLDGEPSRGVKFYSKAVTAEGSQIGSGSMDSMIQKLLDLVESWGDSGQEQGETSDGWRIEVVIASRPKYKRGKKKGDQYLVTWEGEPLHRASWLMDKDLRRC